MLLTTRHEAFLLCALLYVADGFRRRGVGFVRWALPAVAGGAPATLLLLLYDWRITGSPFTTTLSWVSPEIGFGLHASGGDGPHSAARGALHTLIWLGSWRLDPLRLATAQPASFVGFAIGFAAFAHLQTENRLTPLRLAGTAPAPALVLMRDFGHRYVAWQGYSTLVLAKDYTRNGLGALGPVAIGLDLGEVRTARLCKQMPERAIYRVELDRIGPHGSLAPVCNGATPINERP